MSMISMQRATRPTPFTVSKIAPRSIPSFNSKCLTPRPIKQHSDGIQIHRTHRMQLNAASDDESYSIAEPVAASTAETADGPPETIFYEGSGSNAELLINILLAGTLLYIPLTLSAVGRRLWIKYKFTNRRVIVETNSPVVKRTVEVDYSKIKEVRSVPRAFGAWGDMVIFLKDGSRLELVGLEKVMEIRNYIEGFIID